MRIFHEFEPPYLDVRGDGAFALFNSDQSHRALAATVSFKTFVTNHFIGAAQRIADLPIGGHFGIDRKTVLVRKFGITRLGDRQNEVWSGKPVNMAAKLASSSTDNELWVSDRFFQTLRHECALKTCGCPNRIVSDLWQSRSVADDDRFDFDVAYVLRSNWRATHGKAFCGRLLSAD